VSLQINLFNPAFRRRRELISGFNLALALAILILLLGLFYGGISYWAGQRVELAAASEAKLNDERLKLTTLLQRRDQNKLDPGLQAELQRTQQSIRTRQDLISVIDAGVPGSGRGYTEYMHGLARQVQQGMWLTGFVISDAGKRMEIRGSMLNADALPGFIERLNNEPVFKGHVFSTLNISPLVGGKEVSSLSADSLPVAATTKAEGGVVSSNFWLASEGLSSFGKAKTAEGEP
jgi:hypothetical protein